jgi:hypothetical protein
VLGAGWSEVVALVAAFAVAIGGAGLADWPSARHRRRRPVLTVTLPVGVPPAMALTRTVRRSECSWPALILAAESIRVVAVVADWMAMKPCCLWFAAAAVKPPLNDAFHDACLPLRTRSVATGRTELLSGSRRRAGMDPRSGSALRSGSMP